MACPFRNLFGGAAYNGPVGRRGPNHGCCGPSCGCCGQHVNPAAAAAETAQRLRNDRVERPAPIPHPPPFPPPNGPGFGCASQGIVGNELYGAVTEPPPVFVSCTDPLYGCRQYCLADRDPYWPTFCHPRWLSCDALYHAGHRPH